MKDGKKRKSERKFFPGYVLVEMEMNDDTWHIVKECPKVLGFIGGTPENQHQSLNVKQMRFLRVYVILVKRHVLKRCLSQVKNYLLLTVHSQTFKGVVEEVQYDKSRLTLTIVFNRPTQVELEFRRRKTI